MKLEQVAHWAEIIASAAVIATLVMLIQEVRGNTLAIERQADLDRAAALTMPFFSAPELASVLTKIKVVDGADPLPQAFIERYGLTPEEAVLWERHLWLVWLGYQADFEQGGRSAELEAWIAGALASPDNRLYWDVRAPYVGGDFRAFVDRLAGDAAN